MPTAPILNQERERWARHRTLNLSATSSTMAGQIVKQTNIPIAAQSSSFSATLIKKTLFVLVASTASFAGSLIKKTLHGLTASTANFSGSLIKKTIRSLVASTANFAGSLTKKTIRSLAASTASFAGSLIKKTIRSLVASTANFAGSLIKKTIRSLVASTASFAGTLVKKTLYVLSVMSASFNATLTKKTLFVLAATSASFSATLSKGHLFVRTFTATMSTMSGSLAKKTLKSLNATTSSFAASFRKLTSILFGATTTSFSATISSGGHQFQKAFNATTVFFSAILTAIKSRPTPSVIIPVSVATPIPSGNGVSLKNPSVISTSTNGMNMFGFLPSPFATPDGWGLLGQRKMGANLLVAPRNGYTNGLMYVAASGDITIPSSALGSAINFVLNENYFSRINRDTQVSSDPLATLAGPQSLTVGTHVWSLKCQLSGSGFDIISNYTIMIDGVSYSNTMFSNRAGLFDPHIQLSLAAQFLGSVSGSDVFQIRATQFELQQ